MAVNFTRESAGRVKLACLLPCAIPIKQLCSIPLLSNLTSSAHVLKETCHVKVQLPKEDIEYC
jgi:hypothetical protein